MRDDISFYSPSRLYLMLMVLPSYTDTGYFSVKLTVVGFPFLLKVHFRWTYKLYPSIVALPPYERILAP
jgi:hypothetical protein